MALQRRKLGEDVTILAPKIKLKKIQKILQIDLKNIIVYDFYTNTDPKKFKKDFSSIVAWLKKIPNLENFDKIICDNLVEILSRYPSSILSAQFFWHDIIKGTSKKYINFCEELLDQHKPQILGCRLFSMQKVKDQLNFTPVKLYKNPKLLDYLKKCSVENSRDLLITGGSTKLLHYKIKEIISKLLLEGPGEHNHVYIDKELMPLNSPGWISGADFSLEMYSKIKSAICRPGLGVITDLLTVGAKITPIFEKNNNEMTHNANVLNKLSKNLIHKGIR